MDQQNLERDYITYTEVEPQGLMEVISVQIKILRAFLLIATSVFISGCGAQNLVITQVPATEHIKTGSILSFTAEMQAPEDVNLEYEWTVSSGTIVSDDNKSIKWQAPTEPGVTIIALQVISVNSPEKATTATLEIPVVAAPEIIAYSNLDTTLPVDKEVLFEVEVKDLDTPAAELTYTWNLNDIPISDATGPTFTFTPYNTGKTTIKVAVRDGIYEAIREWDLDIVDLDSDGDGLTDSIEKLIGTDLNNQDTDNDGLSDYDEIKIGTDPLNNDTDMDGLDDRYEIDNYTNPMKADTDQDGVCDKDDIAPWGNAYLKIILNSLKLSPINLKENPSNIFFNVYINGEMVFRIPEGRDTLNIEAGKIYRISQEIEYDLPDEHRGHNVSIEVMEKDLFFNDHIDINPKPTEKNASLQFDFKEGFTFSEKTDGTLDGIKEEDGMIAYEISTYIKDPRPFSVVEGECSGQYKLENNTLTVFGLIGNNEYSGVVITATVDGQPVISNARVRSGVYFSKIELNPATPQMVNYVVKSINENDSRELYQGFVPYPDANTFEAYYQQELEKKRVEQERAEHIASQHGLAYIWSKNYVKQGLKAPSTAKFPSMGFTNDVIVRYLGNGQYYVRTYVDAENSFGAKIRTYYTCILQYNEYSDSMSLINLTFDE